MFNFTGNRILWDFMNPKALLFCYRVKGLRDPTVEKGEIKKKRLREKLPGNRFNLHLLDELTSGSSPAAALKQKLSKLVHTFG